MSADSGVKSPQPGGELSEGKEGEKKRRQGAFIGVVRGGNGRVINRELMRSNGGRCSVSGVIDGRRLKTTDVVRQVGPTRQRGGRPLQRTGSAKRFPGPRARIATGPKRFPGVQFHFYFVFLLFSFLFPFFFYSDFSFEF
jgi:hypothetical protein